MKMLSKLKIKINPHKAHFYIN